MISILNDTEFPFIWHLQTRVLLQYNRAEGPNGYVPQRSQEWPNSTLFRSCVANLHHRSDIRIRRSRASIQKSEDSYVEKILFSVRLAFCPRAEVTRVHYLEVERTVPHLCSNLRCREGLQKVTDCLRDWFLSKGSREVWFPLACRHVVLKRAEDTWQG